MVATPAWSTVFEVNGNRFRESNALVVDNNWFDMFDYKILQGSLDYFLENPGSVILTRSKAAKYFGDLPPLGQRLYIDSVEYSVAAVIENIPANSSFQQDVLISNTAFNEKRKSILDTWGYYSQLLFINISGSIG